MTAKEFVETYEATETPRVLRVRSSPVAYEVLYESLEPAERLQTYEDAVMYLQLLKKFEDYQNAVWLGENGL